MITASIQFKSKKDLDIFLKELKSSLNQSWEVAKGNSKSNTNKSFLQHKTLTLITYFVDDTINSIMRGFVELGIFNNYIKILSVSVGENGLNLKNEQYGEINRKSNYYKYIIGDLLESVIKTMVSYDLIENKDLLIKFDLHQQVEDLRMSRPMFIKEKATNTIVTLNKVELHKVKRKTYEFVPPNNIALLLNISKRELVTAKDLFNKKFKTYFGNKSKCKFEKERLTELYNYFEHIQTSLIFCYTAVEAFCNIAIPDNYKYEFVNNIGVKEIWDKKVIEKHLRTSEKVKNLLPEILNVDKPDKEPFWSKFDALESIRNNLIHQKTSDENYQKSAYQEDFLKESIFSIIYSGFELIEYFCNADTKHSYFPMGISNSDIKIQETEKFTDSFKKYDYENVE